MDLVIASGTALRHFTRAISCLTKWGEEIHVSASSREFKLSSINSARTAFAAVTFPAHFFAKYHVRLTHGETVFSFSVVGKALLSPLRPRSANTIETCSISVAGQDLTQYQNDENEYDDDDTRSTSGPATAAAAQCRIVIRLHCQHGIIKTHRMTYSSGSTALYPQAKRDTCTSNFVASSRILKEWTDHFHLRSGTAGGGSDEISFDLQEESCRLRSFGIDTSSAGPNDALAARPVSTELGISISDFETYAVHRPAIITFGLKEFKSIIGLADAVPASIDAACSKGGSPILILVDTEDFKADFAIATTDFDGDNTSTAGSGQTDQRLSAVKKKDETPRANGNNQYDKRNERPLFNRAETTQEPGSPTLTPRRSNGELNHDEDEEEEEHDYGEADDFGDEAFAQIDQLTQEALSQRPSGDYRRTGGIGPTQSADTRENKKQKRWNLLDDSPSP